MKSAYLDVECQQECRDFDGASDDADEMRRRRQRLDVEPQVDQAQDGQQDRQAEPQPVQQVPGDVPVLALPDQLQLERGQKDQGRRGNVDEGRLLEADRELWVVGVPRQVGVP